MTTRNSQLSFEESLQKIIDYYGEVHQEEKAIEEMAELTKEIVKSWQCDSEDELYDIIDNIHEELADVYVMVNQLMLIYDKDIVMKNVDAKIARTLGRIEGEKEE